MKRWYQSKINWTQIVGVVLTLIPFLLSYLDIVPMALETKTAWSLFIQAVQSLLTTWLRNTTACEPIGNAQDVAAHDVFVRAFDEKNMGA